MRLRPLPTLLLGALVGLMLGMHADARQVIVPFAIARLSADGNGALAVVNAGACGTLGPITAGANVPVAADSTGALSICGTFGGAGTGSVTTIEENNAALGGADVVSVDFLGADFDLSRAASEVEVVIAAAITRDSEWDTIAEIETATSVNIIVTTEIDTIAEIETLAAGVNILLETEIDASTELIALMDDETGTGALVFGTSPTFTTSAIFGTAGVSITDDGDGGWTWLGRGNGSDEDLTWNFDDVSNEIGLSSSTGVTILDFGAINVEVPCVAYNEATWNASEAVPCMDAVRDQFEALVVGGAVAYDDVADPDANSTIAFAGFTNIWTSTLDNGIVFEISDTDADAAADTILLKLSHDDGADANVIFLQLIGDKDGTPATVFQVSETAAIFGVDLTVPTEVYDATGWNGDLTAPTKDAVRDILETFVTISDPGQDAILFWDDSDGAVDFLTTMTHITITGNTLALASTATIDTEWDTIAEIETITTVNILLETEIDASSELLALMDDETGTGVLVFGTSPTFTTSVILGAAGVSIADDGDGAITLLGLGNGSDENLTINLDDTANTVVLSTSTGVTSWNFGGFALLATLFNVEDTGNTLTTVSEYAFTAGACQNATASGGYSTPTTLGAAASCESTAAASGDPAYATAVFPTGGADTEVHWQLPLPDDWTGAVDAKIVWRAVSTTANDVVWRVALGCTAAAEASTAISFNTSTFGADTNLGTTLQHNHITATGLTTTGCAAGETMFIKVLRDTDTAGDTLDADVQLVSLILKLRRAQ